MCINLLQDKSYLPINIITTIRNLAARSKLIVNPPEEFRRIGNICLSTGSYFPPGEAVEITILLQEIGYIDIHIDLDLTCGDRDVAIGCHTAITL